MAQWYCHVGGQQYGPVDEAALRQWIAEGRVRPTDPVWREGMPGWAPAMSIPELRPTAFGAGPPPLPTPSMVGIHPPGGSGGQATNSHLTAQARAMLSGRWGTAIAFMLVAYLLAEGLNLFSGFVSGIEEARQPSGLRFRATPDNPWSAFAQGMSEGQERSPLGQTLSGLGTVASLILSGPFALSAAIFFLSMGRGGKADLDLLFSGFHNFGTALGVYLLGALLVFLWALLLIVPGIIAALAYSQAMYLLADDCGLGVTAALRKSRELMRGHKGRLFCLHLRFVGWTLLCLLTCGVGFLWLAPYRSACLARFYEDLLPPRGA